MCECYLQARTRYEAGVHTVSVDEMTGIQALERKHDTKPSRPGLIERREFEYIRHGTVCLFGNLEVALGRVISPKISPTRSEEDFAEHIAATVATDSDAEWIFIADNLNTHKSESLVRWVADVCGIEADLGRKGKSGILKSVPTRSEFLSDQAHRIRFVYLPKHTSWLNQIEVWFSILVRRVIKRGHFTSREDLEQKLLAFINYFNETMAKPFKWTFTGRPLNV